MLFLPKDFCVGSFFSLSGKTPHPSAYGCHLLPPEKAGKVHVTVESKSILHIGWLLCNTKFKKTPVPTADKPSPAGEGVAACRDG